MFRILIGKSKGKKSLGRPMRIYESMANIQMYFKGTEGKAVNCNHLPHAREQ